MSWLKKLGKKIRIALSDDDKKDVTPRPKIPRKFKLTYPDNIRPKTKDIIESQMPKALDDFNCRVDEWSKWIKTTLAPYYLNHLSPIYPSLIVNNFIYKLDKNELLAFRVALSKNPPGPTAYQSISKKIKYALKQKEPKYILRTSKR